MATREAAPVELTVRERELLYLIAAGNTNAEVAAIYGVHPNTAKRWTDVLGAKVGARKRRLVAGRARALGLLDG